MSYEERARARLLRRVEVEDRGHPTPCWIFTGATNARGYGVFGIHGRQTGAHRASYELHVGPIPEGLTLDHLCRVRDCVNPAHLEPVTPVENVMRGAGFAPTNAAKTHCDNGHPFTDENTYLTPEGWRACRRCKREWRATRAREKRAARGLEPLEQIATRVPTNPRVTRCKRGHPYDADNTYVDPRGKRQCRTCIRDRYEARKVRAAGGVA